jgi:hypothetical protein
MMWEAYVLLVLVNVVVALVNVLVCIWEHDTHALMPWVLGLLAWGSNFFWGVRRMEEKNV